MLRPTNYPTRDCETCQLWFPWREYGWDVGGCLHPVHSSAQWRINLEEWAIDPAQYCDDYEFRPWND